MTTQHDPPADRTLPTRIVRRLATTRAGMWITSRWLGPIDVAVHRRTQGRTTLTSMVTDLPIAVVETTGARSGQRRQSPLIALPTRHGVAVVGSDYGSPTHPGWVHNLRAHPRGQVTLDDETWDFEATEVEGDRRAVLWAEFERTWPGYARYELRAAPRRIPVFELARV